MFIYVQKTGCLYREGGELVGTGYSGKDEGLNNPTFQDDQMIGPIPEGFYTIAPAYEHPKLGPVTMNLIPDNKNEMFGRALFRIHGDNVRLNHSASEGCIILGRQTREVVAADASRRLQVVAQL